MLCTHCRKCCRSRQSVRTMPYRHPTNGTNWACFSWFEIVIWHDAMINRKHATTVLIEKDGGALTALQHNMIAGCPSQDSGSEWEVDIIRTLVTSDCERRFGKYIQIYNTWYIYISMTFVMKESNSAVCYAGLKIGELANFCGWRKHVLCTWYIYF